ncbi:MAG: hypothetical protein KAG56_05835 [Sulfurovaceae bacterium]|nr:hypothetical protein [Sulfurovaceae bacterium]
MKKIINLFLLVVMTFSITHEIVLDTHDDNHCSLPEYLAEFSAPDVHDSYEHQEDVCDTHFIFHISFLMPENFILSEISYLETTPTTTILTHTFTPLNNTFRPPIV